MISPRKQTDKSKEQTLEIDKYEARKKEWMLANEGGLPIREPCRSAPDWPVMHPIPRIQDKRDPHLLMDMRKHKLRADEAFNYNLLDHNVLRREEAIEKKSKFNKALESVGFIAGKVYSKIASSLKSFAIKKED